MKLWMWCLSLSFLVACGGPKIKERELEETEHTGIERDYEVKDASSQYRPAWIEDADLWAKQSGEDLTKFRYFSHETTANVDRKVACKVAQANAKSNIAGEITSFIEESLGSYSEGNASIDMNNPDVRPMKEFVENTLASKTMALIHGARTDKTYWEKRSYLKSKGAKKDFIGWTCAVLIKMEAEELASLVRKASDMVGNNTTNPELKVKVEKALANAEENFVKSKKGEL